ncbi:hypothetical protein L596_018734 [Steinernema carpocapsae]|uniref:Uncharacterized protein n=1 Tax=Steinernema carpocapsae TaxID=34508 RepID=A0A4U5N5K2_STECR|nr:hypothetical protein L596_018734 [Steinernema carpocapsae]
MAAPQQACRFLKHVTWIGFTFGNTWMRVERAFALAFVENSSIIQNCNRMCLVVAQELAVPYELMIMVVFPLNSLQGLYSLLYFRVISYYLNPLKTVMHLNFGFSESRFPTYLRQLSFHAFRRLL